MIYLDSGATSYPKPAAVGAAMQCALDNCTNPGRGGYRQAMNAAATVLRCRERAGSLFDCSAEEVVMTPSCTYGLNMAVRTLISPGDRVVISGFEHNAVTRPLHAAGARVEVAGRRLFNWADTLECFENALKKRPKAAVFTHVSNVFGYILPVEEMASLCRQYAVAFVVDAAQSAGTLPVKLHGWGADFIAIPGHKGLLGPQGTGILLCGRTPKPLLQGGTGSLSKSPAMPDFLPDAGEAGTLNIPGIAGLSAGLQYVQQEGANRIFLKEQHEARRCAEGLKKLGFTVYSGENQGGTVSFSSKFDCEQIADFLGKRGICVRSGLHCAPLAHESAGTLDTGTVRVSFGHTAGPRQTGALLLALRSFLDTHG